VEGEIVLETQKEHIGIAQDRGYGQGMTYMTCAFGPGEEG